MTIYKETIHNVETGETIEVVYNKSQIAEIEANIIKAEIEAQKELKKAAAKSALLAKLGITADEAKLLLS
jgi:hypothetical protein